MKFLKLLPICIVLFMVSCKNETKVDANGTVTPGTSNVEQKAEEPVRPLSAIEIKADTYDFGKIKDGTVVEHVFKFKNIGKNELVLKDVKASCGCTTPTWPREPIAPGAESEIKASFNSTGKSSGSGEVMKTITITANTDPSQTFLYIKGTVTPLEDKK
jgi:hypothetical protein